LITYIVVGPAVACVAMSTLIALLVGPAELSAVALLALPATIGGVYLVGWKAAAFVGLLMTLVEPRLVRRWSAFVIATLLGGCVTGLLFPPLFTDGVTRDIVLGSASIGAVSGLACAAVDRFVQTRLSKGPVPSA
jgi:hypothetical protein